MVTTKQQRLHSATEVHPLGTWGNCPVGVARAAGYQNVDAVLAKQFSAGGSRYFEFRAEDEHAELRTAGARHQQHDHLWPDHEHRQYCSNSGAGIQVLLLAES